MKSKTHVDEVSSDLDSDEFEFYEDQLVSFGESDEFNDSCSQESLSEISLRFFLHLLPIK